MPVTRLDERASLARTALTDPFCLPDREQAQLLHGVDDTMPGPIAYAVARLDEIIDTLDPPIEDRESNAATTDTLRAHVLELLDRCARASVECREEDNVRTYKRAATSLAQAEILLRQASEYLTGARDPQTSRMVRP